MNTRAVCRREVGEHDVLLRREAEFQTKCLHDLAHRGSQVRALRVMDPPVLHEEPVAVHAISLLVPAEVIPGGLPVQPA